jgi:hypothetical protein
VLLAQGQPFGIALLEFGHGPGSQGIGPNFVDHGRILQVTRVGERVRSTRVDREA